MQKFVKSKFHSKDEKSYTENFILETKAQTSIYSETIIP